MTSLAGVAGDGHQAVSPPGSKLKRHNPVKTSYSKWNDKRGSAAQSHAWGTFGGASCGWGTLTEDQYQAWEEAAKQEKRRRHWPASRRFTGQNLFTEINAHQRFLALPAFLYPPERPVFGLCRPGPLTAGDGSDWFPLNLGVPKKPAGHTLVFGSPPCPAGRRVCRDFLFLGLLPPPNGGVSELTWQYVAKFGSPPPGSRIFIRTWQQIDGWRDSSPTQFTVVIPGKPHPAARQRRRRATGMA